MSLHVLKRKSQHYTNSISGKGKNGFSLNGWRRNIGAVGETNLARTNIKSCNVGCFDDTKTVKKSVKTTSGLLAGSCNTNIKSRICKPTGKNNIVQPMGQYEEYSQSNYINKKVREIGRNSSFYRGKEKYHSNVCLKDPSCVRCEIKCHNNCTLQHIGGKPVPSSSYTKDTQTRVLSSSDYQRSLYMKKLKLPSCPDKEHFPMRLMQNNCRKNYTKISEAKAHGLYLSCSNK